GLSRRHQSPETALHKRFRFIEVHRPPHTEDPVAEKHVRPRVPVRVADALPRRRPKVIRYDAEHLALPRPLDLGLGEFGGYGGREKAECNESKKATGPAQSPHTSVKRSTRVTLHVFHSLVQTG